MPSLGVRSPCHHKLSPMNNNHILDRKMMVNVSNQLILCGLSMMTPWCSLIVGSFLRTSLTVHTVCYLAQTLNKRKCAIKLKSLFPIWLNCRFGSSVCYFYSGTSEGFLRAWTFCEGHKARTYLQTPLPLTEFLPIGQWNRFE